MANKERTVDLVVRARDQYSKVLANLKKQQEEVAAAGRKPILLFNTSTRRELVSTQNEIRKLAGEFRTLNATQGASRAQIAQVVLAKAKLQAKAAELKASLDGVAQASHRMKTGQQASFVQFSRNASAMRDQTTAANQTATALRRVESASRGAAMGQAQLAGSTAMPRGAMNRGGDRAGRRGENQDVEIYGLRPYQMVNLGYQVNDVLGGLAMGQAPLQIFAQQIGQVIQIWPQLMVALVKGLPILGAVAAAMSPFIVAANRLRNEAESLRYFTAQLAFMADGGRYSAQSLAETSREFQKLGVAIEDARKLALGFAKAGMSQSSMLPIVRMARDLSSLTGADIGETAEKLGKAFRGTVDDVRELDKELQFLTAAQLESIRAMENAGNRAGAMATAQRALGEALADSRAEQTDWGAAVEHLDSAWNKLITSIENSGVIYLAAKGLDLLALSARGAAAVVDEVANSFVDDDRLAAQFGRARLEIARLQNEITAEQRRIEAGTMTFGMMGGISTVPDDSRLIALQEQLAAVEAQYDAIVEQIKDFGRASQEATNETEEQKKLTLDISDLLQDQVEKMREETQTAALTNRERYIEAALLEARNKALERAKELGLEFNGLTAEQNRMLREQAGMTFDRGQSTELMGSGMSSLVDRIIGVESGGNKNAKNPNSSATGLGQFIESTWLSMFRKYFPAEAARMGKDAILELRKDAAVSRQMVELYARENAKILQSAGVAVNDAALYLAHFLGPRGAAGVLAAAPNTPVSNILGADQINANSSILQGKNAAEVVAWAQKKMGISQTELAVTTRLGELDAERLKTEQDYGEAYRQRIANQQFEISQASQLARQAAINKAIRDEELTAQKAGLTLSAEQRAEIERTTGALFDRQNVEMEVNRLLEHRSLLIESLDLAQSEGDSDAVARVVAEITQTETELQRAIDAAIAFWQAIGGPGADAAIMKLQNLRAGVGDVVKDLETRFLPSATAINEQLAEVGSNAFSKMAEAIANGTSVADAFFQTLKQGIGEFLIEIGKAIVKQALFNAISGGSAGGGIGSSISGFITGLFHTGGVLGRDSGSGNRMVNPAIFSGAQRFHNGGVLGLGPNEMPIIGLKDEEMLTRDDPRHILNGGTSGGNTNIKNVNVFNPVDVLEAALASEPGEKVLVNWMTRRARTISGAIGV